MKNKYITSILALFLGWLGIHRFYLGQRGNGVAYILLSFIGIGFILGVIDFFAFIFMEDERFDYKYNYVGRERTDFNRREYPDYRRRRHKPERRSFAERARRRRSTIDTKKISKAQKHVRAGKEHYRSFDYFEAIAQWQKGLEYEPNNAAIHYNLACAYSLTENADSGFYHLSQAVKAGFDNFDKLKGQDELAFLRIQPEFDSFVANNYSLETQAEAPPESDPMEMPAESNILSKDILQQLKDLGELRDRGILTEEEFLMQKKKLI